MCKYCGAACLQSFVNLKPSPEESDPSQSLSPPPSGYTVLYLALPKDAFVKDGDGLGSCSFVATMDVKGEIRGLIRTCKHLMSRGPNHTLDFKLLWLASSFCIACLKVFPLGYTPCLRLEYSATLAETPYKSVVPANLQDLRPSPSFTKLSIAHHLGGPSTVTYGMCRWSVVLNPHISVELPRQR